MPTAVESATVSARSSSASSAPNSGRTLMPAELMLAPRRSTPTFEINRARAVPSSPESAKIAIVARENAGREMPTSASDPNPD